jgi:5-carboxymethyl-2-hydroxymuconate isomerase
MPHLTIETSSVLADRIDFRAALQEIHHVYAANGYAVLADIKSRVFAASVLLVGDDASHDAIVATLQMTRSRPAAIERAMAQQVLETLSRHAMEAAAQRVQVCVFFRCTGDAQYLKTMLP